MSDSEWEEDIQALIREEEAERKRKMSLNIPSPLELVRRTRRHWYELLEPKMRANFGGVKRAWVCDADQNKPNMTISEVQEAEVWQLCWTRQVQGQLGSKIRVFPVPGKIWHFAPC